MEWGRIENEWKRFKTIAQDEWGALSEHHLDAIDGRRGDLLTKLQETYGISIDEAEQQIAQWQAGLT